MTIGISPGLQPDDNLIAVYKEQSTWAARISARDGDNEIVSAYAVGRTPADAIINLGFSLLGKDFPFHQKLRIKDTE